MSGLTISVTTALLTVFISLVIAVLIKIMGLVISKFSRPDHLPIEKPAAFLAEEKPSEDESEIAAAIAITRYLQKPFPVNY